MSNVKDLFNIVHDGWKAIYDVAMENYDVVYAWAKGSIFIYQLLLSIAAAYIFWIVFNWIPYLRRRRKLRPVFELDLMQLRSKLFVMFDCVMSQGPVMTTGFYQRKIAGGKLLEYDIRIGLQNKCVNSNYLYDPITSPLLVPIGHYLSNDAYEALDLIAKALQLGHFASAEEILLLEKIRQELKRFDFKDDLLSTAPSNQYFRPVVTAMTYLETPLITLYGSFMALQKNLYSGAAILEQQGSITQISYLFNSERYKKCLEIIKDYLSNKFDGDGNFLHVTYKIKCLHRLKNHKQLYTVLDDFLVLRPYGEHLASMRDLLLELSGDIKAMEVFRKHFTQEAIASTLETVSSESSVVERFIYNAKFLSRHFASLDSRIAPL